ncbi:MAG TPA: FtsQ-type POTRA domain-containing protein [Kiritimatiellia bacterium]|nr:FtsQ-type POTRA domain-containing protein [Kiritimatiellia bacterium]HOR97981.1 FtsQ-type POTRA domain-containing protein [Kiritimatiellia bacterium]HPK37626.1 FtsQ-type POTRA domain-containing protein [Kiritimatiellia bacterium]HPW74503.1 FtsQ-type POTRA domain-containing protein [Kiritimatiellia bacterium]
MRRGTKRMAWDFFKQGGTQRKRMQAKGRRVTGVVTDLPPGVRFAIRVAAGMVILLVVTWGGWRLFEAYYFCSRRLFVLHNLRENVMITTGRTLTPDLICEVLGLREGVNLFSIPIRKKRKELLEQAPNIRDITIVRRMPDKIRINIIEREPIARVGSNGRVVDEEGVVFIRYAGTGGLPMIKGVDAFEQIKPGDRLRGNELAAVRLVNNAQRPECRLRLLVVDTSKEDYLLLTLFDHRQVKFAWKGMRDEAKDTVSRMQRHFDQLAQAMESEIGRACLMWDATQPGRIFATPSGLNEP